MSDRTRGEREPSGSGAAERGATRLRIAGLLEERMRAERGYSKLSRAIQDAIDEHDTTRRSEAALARAVDRRKLKQIIENDPGLVLSVSELLGLDFYLSRFGESLAAHPLFEKPELLRLLAESRRSVFLLGSKHDPGDTFRTNISHWDVLGLSAIQNGIQGYSAATRLDILETRMRESKAAAVADGREERIAALTGAGGPSIVCLGSSRGNQMTERLLGGMAGVPAFEKRERFEPLDLPFYFVWSDQHAYALDSRFHLDARDALAEDEAAGRSVADEGAAAFRTRDGYLIDALSAGEKREGFTYALCAAQRREDDQIWLLVAGLTGPATCAGARWVHRMPTQLDLNRRRGERSPVFWTIVRSHVTRLGDPSERNYQIGEAQYVTDGVDWDPRGGAARRR